MADPLSIMAIAGLVFAGKRLAKEPEVEKEEVSSYNPPLLDEPEEEEAYDDFEERLPFIESRKREVESFAVIAPQQRSSGTEILNMRNRVYDQGIMNNVSSVEKVQVGPGLGVGPDVVATGGFQQPDFRVYPVNTGEYRLTQLPGRINAGGDVLGGRRVNEQQIGHNRPEKTAYLPERLPMAGGRAQGFSGLTPRAEHERSKKINPRAQTGLRNDGLDKAPAKRFIPAATPYQNPTRFKTDANAQRINGAAPGVSNFHGGYVNSAAVSAMQDRSNENLMRHGFRPEDRREKEGRFSGAGRMNVREGPLKAGGALTTVRLDQTRVDGRFNAAEPGGRFQNVKNADYHKFNAFKGIEDPRSRNLDIAKNQLAQNPFNHNLSTVA